MTADQHEEYLTALAEELEVRDVPLGAVEQIVREVRSHLAESGEDPVSAFGPAKRYADGFAPRARSHEMVVAAVVSALLGAGGAFFALSGAFGLIDGSARLWGLPPWARLALGGLLLGAGVVMLVGMTIRSRRRAAAWHP